MKQKIYSLFKEHDIYVGCIDTCKCYNDDTEEIEEYGWRICFSNHENNLVIPLEVLTELQELCPDYYIQIEQTSAKAFDKPLYMYIRVTK